MLAYSIIQALAKHWRHLDLTVHEGLDQLATLCLSRNPSSRQIDLSPTPHTSRHDPETSRCHSGAIAIQNRSKERQRNH
jgi:hypothetical protein